MDDLVTLLVNGGIVAAILEASKKALGDHFNWTRYGAILALAIGVLTAEAAVSLNWYGLDGSIDYGQAVFAGLMAGITASGLNRGISQSAPTIVVEGQVKDPDAPPVDEVPPTPKGAAPAPAIPAGVSATVEVAEAVVTKPEPETDTPATARRLPPPTP